VNNQASQNTTDLRAAGSIRYANLWQRAHGISVSYMTSPEDTDEVSVWSGTYNWRVGSGGKNLLAYAVSSESSTAALGDLTVIGSGDIVGLRLMTPFGVGAAGYSSVSFGVEYKDFGETVELLGADSYQTPIDYVGFSVQYDTVRRTDTSTTQINIGPYFGLRGFGNTVEEFENKRFNATPNYFYLRGGVEHTRDMAAMVKSIWRLSGQWSASPLISNEEFSAGGASSVRGYYESQVLGDSGLQASIELYSPPLAQHGGGQPRDFRALVFADAATLHINKALPGQDANHDLAGVGLGLRLSMWRTLSARLDWGWALIEAGEVDKGDDRLHFGVDYSF
jgi:hemolysin activation/secretion protein